MNLHGIVAGGIGAINPFIVSTIRESDGYTIEATGKQVPAYKEPVDIKIQVQALEWKDLQQLDAMNVQGERRAVYIYGSEWNGISRIDERGGDLLTFPEVPGGPPRTWLVAVVLEKWPDWVKVAVTLQVEA